MVPGRNSTRDSRYEGVAQTMDLLDEARRGLIEQFDITVQIAQEVREAIKVLSNVTYEDDDAC